MKRAGLSATQFERPWRRSVELCNSWYSATAKTSAAAGVFTASRSAIFSNEKSRFVRDSIRTAMAAICRAVQQLVQRDRENLRGGWSFHGVSKRHLLK